MSTPSPSDNAIRKGLHYNAHILLARWQKMRDRMEALTRQCDEYDRDAWGVMTDVLAEMDALEKEFPTKEIR